MNADLPTASPAAQPRKQPFTLQAAKGSLYSPIIVILIVVFGKYVAARLIVEVAALIIILGGLGLGISALFGIPKHGLVKILPSALISMTINGFLLFVFVTNFLTARSNALNQRVTPTPEGGDVSVATLGVFQNGTISFQYDRRYQAKSIGEKGQVLLQCPDSSIVITDHKQRLDARESLERFAAAIRSDFEQQNYKDISASAFEDLETTNFSGSKVRLEYTRPQNLRVVAEIYMISTRRSSYSFLHYYPQDQNIIAPLLFQTVLNTFTEVDGVSSTE